MLKNWSDIAMFRAQDVQQIIKMTSFAGDRIKSM